MTMTDSGTFTALARYMQETGTQRKWLAAQVGVSSSTMTRWAYGQAPMPEGMRQRILDALRKRAALSLHGLFDGQLEPLPLGHNTSHRTRAEQIAARKHAARDRDVSRRLSGTPFDQLVGHQ